MDWDIPTLGRRAFALLVACCSPAWAAGPRVEFQIPAGHAPQTLREFYLQSRVRVLYLADTVKGAQTQAISGELEASDALARMLQGTGLSYEFDGEYAAVIKRGPDVAAMPHADTTPESAGQGPSLPASTNTGDPNKLEEVLVTGSLIHGVFDITSPLIPVDSTHMKRTGYATVQDALQSLPLAATVTRGEVVGGVGNFSLGSGINLRGLGDAATLVLVNGRRQPVAGTTGDFVDVSNIPWSMVERIEVLPDGGSALYGSDAVAGVVNILMRKDLDGAETQLRYGTAADGAREILAAQLAGHQWDSGQWFAGYQYYERSSLAAAHRDYAANPDLSTRGGRDHRQISSNPGNILDLETLLPAYALPSGQDGTSLEPGDLLPGVANRRNQLANVELLPDKRTHSFYFTATQDLSERVELFAEGRYGERDVRQQRWLGSENILFVPATNAFFVSPYEGVPFALVAYDLSNDLGPNSVHGRSRNYVGTLGVKAELNDSWQTSLAATYGAEEMRSTDSGQPKQNELAAALADPNPATAFNPFGDGSHTNPATIDSLRAINRQQARSDISSVELTTDGTLLHLPAGDAKAAIGAEYREESLGVDLRHETSGTPPSHTHFRRKVAAIFSELAIPLIGNAADSRAAPRLELSLAGRYEQYDDFGRTFNPKLGLRWTPFDFLKLRASWGTSFRAPNLVDLDDARNAAGFVSFQDPRSPTGRSNVLIAQGGNPDLKEERASTWTTGFDLAPPSLPGFQLSLTGYSIHYEDQVIQPGPPNVFDFLLEEDRWTSVITRDPSQSQIDAICASPLFFGDRAQCASDPPAVIVDIRKHNLAIAKVRGLDLALTQSLDTDLGRFSVHVNGTQVFHFERAFTKTAPAVDIADTVNNPLALRLRGTLEWRQRATHQSGFVANLTANYTGGYTDRDSPLRHSVDAWTTFDLGLSYRTARRGGWTDDTELAVNLTNVLDENPPFVDREWGYDVFNVQPTGRVFSAFVSKRW